LPPIYYEANLPVEVVKPYVKIVYNEFKLTKRKDSRVIWPGISEMATITGISSKSISDILSEKRNSVSVDMCDRIALHADFSLDQIFEDTIEWAEKHPEKKWPEDDEWHHGNKKNLKRKAKKKS